MNFLNKTTYSSLLTVLFVLVSSWANAQAASIAVDRSIPVTQFNSNCDNLIVDYSISVTGSATSLVLTDHFASGCGYNVTYVFNGSQPPSWTTSSTPTGGIVVNIPSLSSGTTTFQVELSYDPNAAADYREIELCSPNPVLTSASSATITYVNNGATCVKVINANKWYSDIVCPNMGSYNCYEYEVRINSPVCGGYNLFGPSEHTFTAPVGATITSVIPVSTLSFTNTPSLGANSTTVKLKPGPSWKWTVGTWYTFKVKVEYPCTVFAANQAVTPTLSSSIQCSGWFCIFPARANTCPSISNTNPFDPIPGTTEPHTLPKPATSANLSVSREYPLGHDAAGCQNVLNVKMLNSGSTILSNVDYEMVVPAGVTLKCLDGGTMQAYKTNLSSNWITGATSSMSTVKAMKWKSNLGVSAKKVCAVNSSASVFGAITRICYTINSGVANGTNLDFCVNALYRDSLHCVAAGCVPDPFQTYTDNDCHDFNVTAPEPDPDLFKEVIGSNWAFPSDPLTFRLRIKNCGSGNLTKKLTDIIDPNLTITSITYNHFDAAVGSWSTGHNGWMTTDNTSGNNVDIDVDVPGSCLLQSNCCTQPICNYLDVIVNTEVNACVQAANKWNYASLNTTPVLTKSDYYEIRNRNQLNAEKKAAGDISTGYSNHAISSPSSNVVYQIKVYNNNPQRWHDPVVVDLLPIVGTRSMCGGNATPSTFKVELAGAPVVTFSNIGMSSYISQVGSTTYGDHSINSDNDICGSGSQTINSASWTSGNGAFKLKFNGYLDCGDSIIIDVPAKIVGGTSGDISFNTAYIRQKNAQGNYTPSFAVESLVEIEDWTPDCCENEVQIRWGSEKWKGNTANVNFDIQNGSMIPVQKLRVTVVDFSYQSLYDDCKICHTPSADLAALNSRSGYYNLGGLVPNRSAQLNRERTWDLGSAPVTGTPILLTNWTGINLDLQLPSTLSIPCCKACVYVCFKVEVTDVNCNTCVSYICRRIILPEPKVQPNSDACSNTNDDTTDPNGGGSSGGTKPWLGDIKDVKDLKIKEGLELKPFCPTCPR